MALSAYALLRYYSFRTLYFDLGIFSSSMSQVVQGTQGIQTLLFPSTPGHVGHFSPILVIPLAFYAILPSPATLLVFQSLLLALAALPLFELTRELVHRTDLALALALAYLLYPALQGVNRYDFHVESFVPLLTFVAGLAVVQQRFRLFLVASLLLLCTHEYLSIVFLWTGGVVLAYQVLLRKPTVLTGVSRRWAATAALLGAVFLALEEALNVLLTPSHASVFAWLSTTTSTYSGGPLAILSGAGADLSLKLLYWLLLLVPLLLLPLRDWRLALPAIPWLGITVLASNRGIYSIYSQYPALVLPFLFFAAAWALRRPNPFPRTRPQPRQVAAALIAVSLVATATIGPLSPLNAYDGWSSDRAAPPYPPAVTSLDHGTAAILGLIPAHATVLAQNELYSQVSDRHEVAPYWNVSAQGPPEYIAIDAGRTWFGSVLSPYPEPLSSLVPGILANSSYWIAGFCGSAFVYALGGPAVPAFIDSAVTLPASFSQFPPNWTAANGTATWSDLGLNLVPGYQVIASLDHRLAAPEPSLLVQADLTGSNSTETGSWSGIWWTSSNPAVVHLLFLMPRLGQVWYASVDRGILVGRQVATVVPGGGIAHFAVLLGGGTVQAWLDGRFVAFVTGANLSTVSAVGVATLSQDLAVSAFNAYRSTAADAPLAATIPWDAIGAGLLILLPAFVVLWFFPQLVALVRRYAPRRNPPR